MFTVFVSKNKLIKFFVSTGLILLGVIVGVLIVFTSVNISAKCDTLPIYRVSTNENKIALTFDVAWGNSDTQQIIDILNELNVKATFFITGEWASKYPDDVRAYFDNDHEIGNHSYSHPYPTQISINDLISDTKKCENEIKKITGVTPALYRTPYGEYDENVISTAQGMGYSVIQWDCDSLDWKDLSADEICSRILPKVKCGSILLFHTDKENTHSALPSIIKSLKAEGYEFVTVSNLIYKENYDIDANGEQYLVSN